VCKRSTLVAEQVDVLEGRVAHLLVSGWGDESKSEDFSPTGPSPALTLSRPTLGHTRAAASDGMPNPANSSFVKRRSLLAGGPTTWSKIAHPDFRSSFDPQPGPLFGRSRFEIVLGRKLRLFRLPV
jgi:hypothetical protein